MDILLGDSNQEMTLEQILEAKEAGKRSASRLLLPQATVPQATDAVAGSSYRKQKKLPPLPKHQDTCTYCGTKGHGRNPPTRIRRTECPAYGTKCNHCDKDHHFEKVCRVKNGTKTTEHEHGNAIFDTLCGLSSTDNSNPWTSISSPRGDNRGYE